VVLFYLVFGIKSSCMGDGVMHSNSWYSLWSNDVM